MKRVQDEIELERWEEPDEAENEVKQENKNAKKSLLERTGSCFETKSRTRVFQEDYERVKTSILDPRGQAAGKWNIIFFTAGLVSLFVDPLFFFLPIAQPDFCFDVGLSLQKVLTIARTVYDVFYVLHIAIQFRTAYIAPSSRVFGRGELVIDPWKIAYQYLVKGFWADVMAAIPLPQILVWAILPNLSDSVTSHTRIVLWFTILLQYFLRVALVYPLSSQIVNSTGVMTTEKAWVGAAYNMMLYVLASHLSGAIYYMLTVERQESCWRSVCAQEVGCEYSYFNCRMVGDPGRTDWFQTTNVTSLCTPSDSYYLWGIYQFSVQNAATSSSFLHKYFFCLWIGIQALCSIGQTYTSSIFVGESLYCIANSSLGLILLALLIGNMQRYLESITARLDEWRQKKTDTEQWMHHRQLPHELRQAVRKYGEFKWVATQGVDEEDLLDTLPDDLRREIKRHLCLNLVRQNPLLDQMDARMLDAICERLKPSFCTKSTFLLLEGDPIDEMFFIIRGHLNSTTTNGGLTGFFNSSSVGPGEFCGEELLSWALDHHHTDVLPLSTRTVEAVSEVEAFSLHAEDLNFVASQFRQLHSRRLIHKFRFYSHQWRTWAACFIQAAWRRHKKRQRGIGTNENERPGRARNVGCSIAEEMNLFVPKPGAGLEVYATRLMNSIKRSRSNMGGDGASGSIPERPDWFATENEEILRTSSVEDFLFE